MRAEFANPQHRLLPGGNVSVTLRPQVATERVMIPAAAVQQDAQCYFSWVLTPENKAGQRRLSLDGQQGQTFAVAQGLTAGERVVVEGAQRLTDGAAVTLLN